ncbi:hypothetical protein HDU98_001907 [Podochytrium sp. JEL0797]|nr:hypothetical protein HDU98_001907 [Podochytrium sp. JEL0797]
MSVQPESDQKNLIYTIEQQPQEVEQPPPHWSFVTIAIAILCTFALTPILAICPLCLCLNYAEQRVRASYNLGVAVGIGLWGFIFAVGAIIANGPLIPICTTTLDNAIIAKAESSYSGSSSIAQAVTQNQTFLNQMADQTRPLCAMALTYVMYVFILFAVVCIGVGLCMCHRSRKILRRVGFR